MIEPLPNELVDCILSHLYTDAATLFTCALVGRAWVRSSQRGIFHSITLKYRGHPESSIDFNAYLRTKKRLVESLDANPRLGSYASSLDLELPISFAANLDQWKALYTFTAAIVQRLYNLHTAFLRRISWDRISLSLREVLSYMLEAPSLTRIYFDAFFILTFPQLASLLSQMKHLKRLEVASLTCNSWDVPSALISPDPLSGPGLEGAGPPSRSIHLNHLLLCSNPAASWFLADSCPFALQNLESLELRHMWSTLEHELAVPMVQRFGGSLKKLVLELSNVNGPSVIHLGHMPNLNTAELIMLATRDGSNAPSWLRSFFEPFLNSDGRRHPLQCLKIDLMCCNHVGVLETPQLDQWAAFDAVLEKPEFTLLERFLLDIRIIGRSITSDSTQLLSGKLPFLKDSGKLKVSVECDT
ncbi:hypothetical protein BT96DRAFT_1024268 [Gymnopus androsaceus JB14]|uniref:F-box domain-containing protein n=1 Tax=Gymnopus androsaceus JB14 TaxID=1447944 RepID=A0A6A4H022_9AGAR|nr:hypothetical protein BT96DRAFT_1024268 [Gymnopus androsaceus JB14]